MHMSDKKSQPDGQTRSALTNLNKAVEMLTVNPALIDALAKRPDVLDSIAKNPELLDTLGKNSRRDDLGPVAEDTSSKPTGKIDNHVKVSRGQPALLSQSDIGRLAKGEVSKRINARIVSQPIITTKRPKNAATSRFSPVSLDKRILKEVISLGRTSEELNKVLELSAKTEGRFGIIKDALDSKKLAPTVKPEN